MVSPMFFRYTKVDIWWYICRIYVDILFAHFRWWPPMGRSMAIHCACWKLRAFLETLFNSNCLVGLVQGISPAMAVWNGDNDFRNHGKFIFRPHLVHLHWPSTKSLHRQVTEDVCPSRNVFHLSAGKMMALPRPASNRPRLLATAYDSDWKLRCLESFKIF